MKYLLDTAIFLYMIFDQRDQISKKTLQVVQDFENELYFSAVSAWEIAIKYSLGKLVLQDPPQEWLPDIIFKMGLRPLPISQAHAFFVAKLPYHHRDPFDRLLIAQAKLEKLKIITPDKIFKKYRIPTVW